jgi:hypothetical protein
VDDLTKPGGLKTLHQIRTEKLRNQIEKARAVHRMTLNNQRA